MTSGIALSDRIDGLVGFLDTFETSASGFGLLKSLPGTMPFYEFSDIASRFIQAAYDFGWVLTDFDWSSWEEGQRYVDDPDAIERASVTDIERLLTAHIRQDRFCEGHLGAMYDCGHLTAILRRLRTLDEESRL